MKNYKELINTKKLVETNKPYYCSDINYFETRSEHVRNNEYESWEDFKDRWGLDFTTKELDIEFELNLIFRYDLHKHKFYDDNFVRDKNKDYYYLELFFIHQRDGYFRPVIIRNIKVDDLKEINILLNEARKALLDLWQEESLE